MYEVIVKDLEDGKEIKITTDFMFLMSGEAKSDRRYVYSHLMGNTNIRFFEENSLRVIEDTLKEMSGSTDEEMKMVVICDMIQTLERHLKEISDKFGISADDARKIFNIFRK